MWLFLVVLSIGFAILGSLATLVGIAFHVGNKANKDYSKRWWQFEELRIAGLSILCFSLSYLFWP